MPNSFEVHPDGAKIGIAEHERIIKRLQKEEAEIIESADENGIDQVRMDEIAEEINYRTLLIGKLRPFE